MKKFKVYFTDGGYGSEKFYVEDDSQEAVIFEAKDSLQASTDAIAYIYYHSLYDIPTIREWINKKTWFVEEV